MPTEEQMMKIKETSKKRWILEVDLDCPEELHAAHNIYPLAPEKKVVNSEQVSRYQKSLMADLNLGTQKSERLVLTLEDKVKYVAHFRNLQKYFRLGLRLKKVHWDIELDQEPWMGPYIRMITEFSKQAKSEFETNSYKLMSNSVFGKTMENPRSHMDLKIVRSLEVGQPLFCQVRRTCIWKRTGRHPHAQNQAIPEQTHVHRHYDSQEQQAADV